MVCAKCPKTWYLEEVVAAGEVGTVGEELLWEKELQWERG